MILIHSCPEEYNHFLTTLLYGKSIIILKYVYTALTNLKIRNNDKHSVKTSENGGGEKKEAQWKKFLIQVEK